MKDYIVYVDITFSRSFNVSAESEEWLNLWRIIAQQTK